MKPIPFWGISGHFPTWFPSRDFYLVSAAGIWSSKRGKFVKRTYPSPRTRMFLDSGGFTFFKKFGDYPFSLDDYLKLVEHPYHGYRPLLWASLDYPCEAEIVRPCYLSSNADRIEATIDHLIYLKRKSTWPGLVPVVQGYDLEDRLDCLEKMARKNLTSPFMAIGSLCTLPSAKMIDYVVFNLVEKAKEIVSHPISWHLFGVKISYFTLKKNKGAQFVFSFDTAAWKLGGNRETRNPKNKQEEKQWFFRYKHKVIDLFQKPIQLPLLLD